ncbi:hypothetical protein [Nocardioides sp.]|uniref:hypothetical protein n=1 Tax=Nocardioides sp. TaxID=35761 RepID=UPI00261E77C6|nr:hypothetical protein [Nocardioides sp.]MDI6910479.1 hypothetical protein [Nocardioides sp.]
MPYAAQVHPQDVSSGRVGEVLRGISGAAACAQYSAIDAAVAYASDRGVVLLEQELATNQWWFRASKRFLVSIDYGITDPRALRRLSRIAGAEVRVPNARAVLGSRSLKPPSTFHPKAYLFRGTSWGSPSALVVGSANLTVSALVTGSEVATSQSWSGTLSQPSRALLEQARAFSEWFDDAWHAADPLDQVLSEYLERYRTTPKPRGSAEDRTRAVKVYTAPAATNVATGTYAVQLMAARAYWIETETLYKNLHHAGSQLDMPRGTRVFFGFGSEASAARGVLGYVALQVPGFREVERSVKAAGNQMDKVNLPVPGTDGPPSYEHSILIFERDGTANSGVPKFKLTVTDDAGLAQRKASAANFVDLQMKGNRRYGLLF